MNIPQVTSPKGPQDRLDIYKWMACNSLITPAYGQIKDLFSKYNHNEYCVVWFGYENLFLPLKTANELWAGNYGVLYIGSHNHAKSTKFIQIGNYSYWIDYESDSWRSNKGKFSKTLRTCDFGRYHPYIHVPMFSIDYVYENVGGAQYAIDFDLYPSIRDLNLGITRKDVKMLLGNAERRFAKEAKGEK